jgi:tetratricopeptide (TPR) repeat protein
LHSTIPVAFKLTGSDMKSAKKRAGVVSSSGPSRGSSSSEAKQTIEAAWRSAVACHRGGHLPQAEELYIAIVNAMPAHADAMYNLGLVRAQTQRYEDSLANFAAAIDLDPTSGDYWLTYIEVLALSGKQERAREVLSQARTYGLSGARVTELASQLGVA